MIHSAWIFAAATIAAAVGIWLLLSQNSSRLRQFAATLVAFGAIAISTQLPRIEGLWADSAFTLLSALLLAAAVATIVSRRPTRCAACFFAALATALALMLYSGIGLAATATVGAACALVPGGFLLVAQREPLRKLASRMTSPAQGKLDGDKIDEPPAKEPRSSDVVDAPPWEPLLCAISGMALTGVFMIVVHAALAANGTLEQLTATHVQNYLTLAAVLLGVGLSGFLSRRSLIAMLLSAEIILLGAMLGCLAGYWAAGYHVSGNLAQQASLGQGSLMVVALAAMGQPIVALAVLYPVSHGLTDRGLEDSSLEDSAEIGLLPGETARGEVLAMAAGLLILMGMLLS